LKEGKKKWKEGEYKKKKTMRINLKIPTTIAIIAILMATLRIFFWKMHPEINPKNYKDKKKKEPFSHRFK
jgi:hypothetical protein